MDQEKPQPLWSQDQSPERHLFDLDEIVWSWATDFHRDYWGKPQFFEPSDHRNGHSFELIKHEALNAMDYHPIMIRKDYTNIWQTITKNLSEKAYQGLCIIGQPGSGKSISLVYLLLRSLMVRQPVAWVTCFPNDPVYLFLETGVRVIKPFFWRRRLRDHGPIVILHDAYIGHAPIKAELFVGKARNYVVLATSPTQQRYKEWTNTKNPVFYVINPMMRVEAECIVDLAPKLFHKAPTYWDALSLFDYLGPSLKGLRSINVTKTEKGATADFLVYFTATVKKLTESPLNSWVMNEDSTLFALGQEPDSFHLIFCVYPAAKSSDALTKLPQVEIRLATDFISNLFTGQLHTRSVQEELEFAERFNAAPSVGTYVFETHAMRWLSWSMSETPIIMADSVTDESIPVVLGTSFDDLNLKVNRKPLPETLYIAKPDTPTIDGLYHNLAKNQLILLQMTTAATHSIKETGLDQVAKVFRGDACLENVILTFVVPDEERGEALIKTWQDGRTVNVPGYGHMNCRIGYTVITKSQQESLREKIFKQGKLARRLVDGDELGHLDVDNNVESLRKRPRRSVPEGSQKKANKPKASATPRANIRQSNLRSLRAAGHHRQRRRH